MIFKQVISNTVHMDEPRIWGCQGRNRGEKRVVEREYNASDPQLAELEDMFLNEILFGRAPYREAYQNILEAYEALCAWIERTRKPKGINLNHDYFVHMYKPVEKELPITRDGLNKSMWYIIFEIHKAIRATNYIPGADMMIGITNFKK